MRDHLSVPRDLSNLFARNPYLLGLSIVVLLIGGLSALLTLPRLEDPRIANRDGVVITPVPGTSAERVESLVTEVLEEALQEVAEIKHLESSSRAGVSVLAIQLVEAVDETTNQQVYAEIRDQIAEARPLLPPEALEPILDDKRDPAGFTMILGLRAATGEVSPGLLDRLAEELADRLRQVKGTELVRLYGAPEEEITVTVDGPELAELGLDAAAVARRVAAADSRGSAGILRGSGNDVLIEVEGELDSLQRIAAIPLVEENGRLVQLGDLAEITRHEKEPTRDVALIDGDRAVLVAARMEPSMRIDLWARAAEKAVDSFALEAGSGIVVDPIFEQESYTSRQLGDLGSNLFAGALVVVVVILFLMGWRLALVVGLALPLVVSAVLLGWKLQGEAIHQMSIFGMIIALGLLIDNAIVVADEVAKERAAGHGPPEAVARAVRHLFFPLLASTLTTVLAFAPILLLTGGVGDFVGAVGGSVILAVVSSFLIALTITAALAGRFLPDAPADAETSGRRWLEHGVHSGRLSAAYRRALEFSLGRPVFALALALVLPTSGFLVARSLGNEFFPPVDRDMFQVQVWLPSGTPIDATRTEVAAIERAIREMPETERVFWRVGASFPSVYYNLVMRNDDTPHYAHGIVTAGSTQKARRLIDKLQGPLDEKFPGAQIVVDQFGQGPPVDADVELRLVGTSLEELRRLGERARIALVEHPDVLHTQTSVPGGEPKLWLRADEDEARLAGLPLTAVAGQLESSLEGQLGGRVVEGPEQLPVRVRHADSRRSDLAAVQSLPLLRPSGDWTTLPAVGELELRPEVGGLTRYDGERALVIKGFTRRGALPLDVSRTVMSRLEGELSLPAGYRLELGGQVQEDADAKQGLAANAPLLVVLMVATLILAFRSLRLAVVLGAVAFLSVGLGFLSTAMIGLPISFNTMLGILGLIGVSLNDSIVVLAAIRSRPAARRGGLQATVDAVMGSTRHVLSTTLTTIGGFLPLLLFVGGDFWPSLAIVLAGGIAGATLIALAFIPAAHRLLMTPRRQNSAPDLVPVPAGGIV